MREDDSDPLAGYRWRAYGAWLRSTRAEARLAQDPENLLLQQAFRQANARFKIEQAAARAARAAR